MDTPQLQRSGYRIRRACGEKIPALERREFFEETNWSRSSRLRRVKSGVAQRHRRHRHHICHDRHGLGSIHHPVLALFLEEPMGTCMASDDNFTKRLVKRTTRITNDAVATWAPNQYH